MHHVLQENIFRESHYQQLIDTFEKHGLDYQIVKIVPFTTDIIFERDVPDDKVMCWGSVKMAHIAKKHDWSPGSFYDPLTHDFRVYAKHYGENMLNHDSVIGKFADDFHSFNMKDYLFFARPCEDTKTFTGQVFTRESWIEFVQYSLTNGHTTTLDANTAIQICPLKDIQREVRVWIVNGKVVTASQYRINERTIYQFCDEPFFLDYAQKMADIYRPADAFVMDVAMVNDELKVVEINCLNCSGFYHGDIQKLVMSIEDNFG